MVLRAGSTTCTYGRVPCVADAFGVFRGRDDAHRAGEPLEAVGDADGEALRRDDDDWVRFVVGGGALKGNLVVDMRSAVRVAVFEKAVTLGAVVHGPEGRFPSGSLFYANHESRALRELCSMGSDDDSTVSQNFTLAAAGGCDEQDEGGRGRGGAAATQPRIWPRKI